MLKRIFDLLLSITLLLLLAPVMAFLALLIFLKQGKPVLFKQQRPGYLGRPFTLYKFRTMTEATNKDGSLLGEGERLTKIGSWIRKYSLDELPQLVNVLKGELSFVGPRPLLMQYLERYNVEQARRHHVKPGITGWAQVNGRNALTWEEKFKLDVWYVDNRSFLRDFNILCLTIIKVFKAEGISGEGTVTMTEFMGSGEQK